MVRFINIQCMFIDLLPNVPVTRGGALPLGVLTVTVCIINLKMVMPMQNETLTIVTNMAKYISMS